MYVYIYIYIHIIYIYIYIQLYTQPRSGWGFVAGGVAGGALVPWKDWQTLPNVISCVNTCNL